MALRDKLKGPITLLLLVAYIAYVVLGLLLMAVSIYYVSAVTG
eukprot:SAG31_NODE_6547_length_1981_cov_2.016472_3_plen_43_part_00